ncbi:translation elongation factor Ts [Halioglobus japonicus]|uniref:Elongation factor Ts n=1 Tax=Halioglobus japonicus TaxID=930805 RepID=A0AAP8ME41_9GAMM|nr:MULTISPECIES: translation elongation factor Ts [Halioglobus]AQA17889.1 translation elongation factor Ts [Halioglobus japonicus]KZX56906.1 elongation factor Ts [Halioglobus sp. HI00S01]PLW85852.1 elongation factor Ts [Halioglobus japonicus]GHD17832.1 elongation factor Ts [Halioglobus japonicus]
MSAKLVKELRDRTGLGLLECKKALAAADGDVDKAIEELRKSSGMKAAKKAGRTAADGVVVTRLAEDGSYGMLVEVNSETDFVARDDNFLAFVNSVADAAFAAKQTDVAALMDGDLEAAREALVQKIGENIGVRRIELVNADAGVVGAYVHGNNRIAVLVELKGGDQDLAKDVAMHVAAVNPQVVSPADMPEEVVAKEKEIYTAQAAESGKPAEIIEKMIGGRVKKFLAENSLLEQAFVKDPDVTVGKLVSAAGAEVASFVRFEVGEGIEVEKVDFADEVAAQLNG